MRYHVNGELVAAGEATVSVRDRGFMYGDAAFETLRAYAGTIFEREAHLDRLRRTCETLGMPEAPPEDLPERIKETLAANDLHEAYVRVSVTRGVQPGKLTPDRTVEPSVVVIVAELPRGGLEGTPVWDDHAVVRTVETRRIPTESVPPSIKTHNYLNGILARLELRHTDADEGLLRDVDGFVSEGATSNVFFVRDDVLATPAEEVDLLPGVTRRVVLELAREASIPVETGRYEVEALHLADEAFLTNTTWELRPIKAIDGQSIGSGPITARLIEAFSRLVERRHYNDG